MGLAVGGSFHAPPCEADESLTIFNMDDIGAICAPHCDHSGGRRRRRKTNTIPECGTPPPPPGTAKALCNSEDDDTKQWSCGAICESDADCDPDNGGFCGSIIFGKQCMYPYSGGNNASVPHAPLQMAV